MGSISPSARLIASSVLMAGASVLPSRATAQDVASGEVLSLERAIHTALATSHDITAAERGVDIADQQVREAWSNVLPDLSASASYQRNLRVQEVFLPAQFFDPDADPTDVTPVRFGSDNTWNASMNFNQPLFEWNVFIGVGAANRFRSLEAERTRGVTQNVVTAVRLAYLNALLALEDLRLTENSVERVRRTLEETRALNRAGLASDYDVLRLEVQLANIEPNLRRAQNDVDESRRALLIEIGRDPSIPVELEGRLFDMDVTGGPNSEPNARLLGAAGLPIQADLRLEDLNEIAVRRRTELRQQRLTINLEEARLASQKAEYYPTLSLFTNYVVTAQTNGRWLADFFGTSNTRTTSAVTGLSVQVPIFQGFARDARVQQTRAALGQYEAQLAKSQKQVENELRSVLDDLEEARLRVASQRRAVSQAGRGFEIASAEYREGVGSQLQITDAEVALRESEFNYARAVYDFLLARARLDAAAGTVPVAAGELAVRVDERGER